MANGNHSLLVLVLVWTRTRERRVESAVHARSPPSHVAWEALSRPPQHPNTITHNARTPYTLPQGRKVQLEVQQKIRPDKTGCRLVVVVVVVVHAGLVKDGGSGSGRGTCRARVSERMGEKMACKRSNGQSIGRGERRRRTECQAEGFRSSSERFGSQVTELAPISNTRRMYERAREGSQSVVNARAATERERLQRGK